MENITGCWILCFYGQIAEIFTVHIVIVKDINCCFLKVKFLYTLKLMKELFSADSVVSTKKIIYVENFDHTVNFRNCFSPINRFIFEEDFFYFIPLLNSND